jgi:hypothetical protein
MMGVWHEVKLYGSQPLLHVRGKSRWVTRDTCGVLEAQSLKSLQRFITTQLNPSLRNCRIHTTVRSVQLSDPYNCRIHTTVRSIQPSDLHNHWIRTTVGSVQLSDPYNRWIRTTVRSVQPLDPYNRWIRTTVGSIQLSDPYNRWICTTIGSVQPSDPHNCRIVPPPSVSASRSLPFPVQVASLGSLLATSFLRPVQARFIMHHVSFEFSKLFGLCQARRSEAKGMNVRLGQNSTTGITAPAVRLVSPKIMHHIFHFPKNRSWNRMNLSHRCRSVEINWDHPRNGLKASASIKILHERDWSYFFSDEIFRLCQIAAHWPNAIWPRVQKFLATESSSGNSEAGPSSEISESGTEFWEILTVVAERKFTRKPEAGWSEQPKPSLVV